MSSTFVAVQMIGLESGLRFSERQHWENLSSIYHVNSHACTINQIILCKKQHKLTQY